MAEVDETGEQAETKGPQWRQMEKQLKDANARVAELEGLNTDLRGHVVKNAAALAGFQLDDKGELSPLASGLMNELTRRSPDEVPTAEMFSTLATEWGVTAPSTPAGTTSLAEQIAATQVPGQQAIAAGQTPVLNPDAQREQAIQAAMADPNVSPGQLLQLMNNG